MATKKQKTKNKPAQSRSPVLSALIGTVLNMVVTAATLGLAWLCLVVAKTLHLNRRGIMLVELFPLIASAMAVSLVFCLRI